MPPHFSSSGGDPWATVGNVAVKIRRRSNGDLAFSVRWPHDASRVIEWRSADAYKGTHAWWRSCDSRAVIREAPFDDPAIETDDRKGIRRLTPWIPHSSINRAGLWWRSSQDAQTSRWILLSQFIVQIDWVITMGQGKKQKGKSGKPRETARREEPETVRAGEADEPSTSQEPGEDSGDEDTATPKLSKPFTNRQDMQIAAFFGQHPCFYDMSHPDYKNKKKRNILIKQFAQSMFTSGKCVLSFKFNFAPIVFLLVMLNE